MHKKGLDTARQGFDVQPDDVLVRVPRVLALGNDAVLAASERLRYGPLKAPAWWDGSPVVPAHPLVVTVSVPEAEPVAQPDLFTGAPAPAASRVALGDALVARATYKAQPKLVGRVAVTDEQVERLLDALATAPDHRLAAARVAAVFGVPTNRVAMMMSQVAKLLNDEGYPVVSSEAATQAVSLDGPATGKTNHERLPKLRVRTWKLLFSFELELERRSLLPSLDPENWKL